MKSAMTELKDKTAMQELIELIDEQYEIPSTMPVFATLNIIKIKATELLEKERQQIIKAADTCANVLIANEIVINGNQELTVGQNYYTTTFTH